MAAKEKIPVMVYQLNLSRFPEEYTFPDVVEEIIKKANKKGDGLTREKLRKKPYQGFEVSIFSSVKRSPPKWSDFIRGSLDPASLLTKCKNTTHSFVCFIGFGGLIFAITGGLGSFSISYYTADDFGLEILVRLFEKNSKVIKSIQDRGVSGIVLGQTKFYRGDQRLSDENQFGKIFKQVNAELNKKILTTTFGFSPLDLSRDVSGCMAKSSFQISKAINFDTLLSLIKRFTVILAEEPKFALNKVQIISRRSPNNTALLNDLAIKFIEDLYQECKKDHPAPDLDFCHKDFEKYLSASDFLIPLADNAKIKLHTPPDLLEIIREIRRHGQYLDDDVDFFKHSLLKRELFTFDENGTRLTQDNIMNHLHGELEFKGSNYFLVDSEWYQILPEFIKELNKECTDILDEIWEDQLIPESFDISKGEGKFNQQFIGKPGWLVFDTVVPENIECCDMLQYDDVTVNLVHVKKGFNNSIRDLTSQILLAAKRLEDDIKSGFKYIDEVERLTKQSIKSKSEMIRKLAGQAFPAGGLKKIMARKHKNISFCLAFVDIAAENRILKNNVQKFQSNIAKYSLIELRQQIRAMGFDFKVIQLNRNLEPAK
ncbi:MAG TPA: DUF6119 family protein [Puia sp.]|jgi:uncharacterized protein (TIGR04141 family)|nr:DUF6119 family protein [Puia sp.]